MRGRRQQKRLQSLKAAKAQHARGDSSAGSSSEASTSDSESIAVDDQTSLVPWRPNATVPAGLTGIDLVPSKSGLGLDWVPRTVRPYTMQEKETLWSNEKAARVLDKVEAAITQFERTIDADLEKERDSMEYVESIWSQHVLFRGQYLRVADLTEQLPSVKVCVSNSDAVGAPLSKRSPLPSPLPPHVLSRPSRVFVFVERFDIEPYSDFSAK